MHHIFATREMCTDERRNLRITGEQYHHIARVLRMKAGEELSVSFSDEEEETPAEYRYGITAVTPDAVWCSLRFIKRSAAELPVRVTLLQALPKGDKLTQIIEKNVELGIYEIVPVLTKRCIVKPDERKAAARLLRYKKIAEAAAKQSRRGMVPQVMPFMTFDEALSYTEKADRKLMPYELAVKETEALGDAMDETRRLIDGVCAGEHIALFIGPEGGFEEEEAAKAVQAGFHAITLGGRILRTETAGMAVMSWLMYRTEGKQG